MEPLVTVGLPIYNAEAYLAECIESIKAQTLKEFTVLAVLDCPNDNSEEILRRHADSRFQIIKNQVNIGLAATCNRMLELCQTELLARMDADDIMYPDRLKKQYDFMQAHPEIDVLGTYSIEIDEQGNYLRGPYPHGTTPEEVRAEFRILCAFWHSSVMFRVARILALGGYPNCRVAEDLILWLRGLEQNYQYAILPETLIKYRVHATGLMNRTREESYQANDAAYAKYGHSIWGAEAPDYIAGVTRWERLQRRMKRNIKRLFSK
ncbi:MAG: glycosyltransferase [bacterium]|nr:glycosyltransferase [bacterium]